MKHSEHIPVKIINRLILTWCIKLLCDNLIIEEQQILELMRFVISFEWIESHENTFISTTVHSESRLIKNKNLLTVSVKLEKYKFDYCSSTKWNNMAEKH
mgnify:CR=1 FL=1